MSALHSTLTLDILRELFILKDGVFIRKIKEGRRPAGKIAGSMRADGYRGIVVRGSYFFEHRLVWWMETGVMPSGDLDHINGIKTDTPSEIGF